MGSEGPGSSDLGDRCKGGQSVQGKAGHCYVGFAVGTSAPATNRANSTKSGSQMLGSWAAGCAVARDCGPAACPAGRAQQPRHRLGWCQQRWSPACKQQEDLAASLQDVFIWGQLELLRDPPPWACAGTQPGAQGEGKGQHCCGLQTPSWGGPHRIPRAPLQRPGAQGCFCLRSGRDACSPCTGLGPTGAMKRFLVLGRCRSPPGLVPGGLPGPAVGVPQQAGM